MSIPKFVPDKAAFLTRYGIDCDQFSQCGLKWDQLVAIANDHCANYSGLLPVANYVTERLRQIPDVHTLRLRIKEPEHLIEKIIRKNPRREPPISPDNYQSEVTDLIGIRALHLFKDQWKPIHDFVTQTWDTHEQPTAYLREGDSSKLVAQLQESGCKVEYHPLGYRSVHYLIKVQPEKKVHVIELQVRTVFEEGWSEIDHRVRYPNHSKDQRLEEFLVLFNTLAGNADEMGSFIKNLGNSIKLDAARIEEMKQQLADKESEVKKAEATLKKTVTHLKISQDKKADLEAKIDQLTAKGYSTRTWITDPLVFNTTLSTFGASSTMSEIPASALSADWGIVKGAVTKGFGTHIANTDMCSQCMKPYIEYSVIVGKRLCPECRAKK